MEVAHNHNSQSQLAKLLAMENITVQHNAAAQTAAFDVKNRVLILPVWRQMSKDLYDMLIIHEVGHALDTPLDGWMDALKRIAKSVNGAETKGVKSIKGFLNVVEDARIDKRQKRRFPGSRRNYVIGMKELHDADFFSTKGRDLNSFSFIDRMNMYFKGGAMLGIKFKPAEMPFIKRAENAETWDEVVALTEEIYAYAKNTKDEEQRLKSDDLGLSDEDGEDYEDESEDWRSGEGSESDDDSDEEMSDDKAEKTDGTSDEKSDEADDADDNDSDQNVQSDKDENSEDKKSADTKSAGQIDEDDDLPRAETDEAWEQNRQQLNAQNSPTFLYTGLPEPNLDMMVHDYKRVLNDWRKEYSGAEYRQRMMEQFYAFKQKENASVSFLVKEFETRKAADVHQRTSLAKTGVIDTNKLHAYRYNDDIFRRLSVVSEGKNHGFVMFLDWSGSMSYNISRTVRQLISLTMFCKRVQIPFEVYLFRTVQDNDGIDFNKCWKNTHNTLEFGSLVIRNILSSRMNMADLNFAFSVLMTFRDRGNYSDAMNSTPLNGTILAASYIVNKFREQSKVQIVNTVFLTDGDSDPIHSLGISPTQYNKNGYRYIVQDKMTKREYDLGPDKYNGATNTLLQICKDRTQSNMIGFFLTTDRFHHIYSKYFGASAAYGEHLEKSKKFYQDNGFIGVSNQGYDKYFLINAAQMNTSNAPLVVSSDMTKAKIAKEFLKFSEKKTVNRVLLRNFIDLIAS